MPLRQKTYRIEVVGVSDSGCLRDNNEDVWSADPELSLYLLADGMGGHLAGEVAAREAVNTLNLLMKKHLKKKTEVREIKKRLKSSIEMANQLVYRKGKSRPEFKGMGTTLCCICFTPSGAVLGHVGDSRIYRLRNHRLEQLTRDDSLVMDLLDSGRISKLEAEDFGKKNIITKAIGTEPFIAPTIQMFDYKTGDIWMTCSDGLSDLVSNEQIEEIMNESLTLRESSESLMATALEKGGHDNITIVQMAVHEDYEKKDLS